MSEETLRAARIWLHPIRLEILRTLRNARIPMYIGSIAEEIGKERRLVSFHLATLEEHGFLESEFKIIDKRKSKGKAGRFYKLTSKLDKLAPELVKICTDACMHASHKKHNN